MPSFKSIALATAVAFVSAANADNIIDPNSVPLSTRKRWCDDQKRTCPMLCQQVEPRTTLFNDCFPESLTYECLCGNNLAPNTTEYSLTLSFHVCREWVQQCSNGCAGNAACITECVEDNRCGAQNPTRVNVTSTPSGTAEDDVEETNVVFKGPGGVNTDDDDENTASALGMGKTYGTAVVLGSLFLGFAMLG